jgi:hypothetical protein
MQTIWDAREHGVDTEEKLVAFILRSGASYLKSYTAQNELIVLDRNDMIELANEVESLK